MVFMLKSTITISDHCMKTSSMAFIHDTKVSGSHPRLMEYGLDDDDDVSGTVMITIMLYPGASVVAW